MAANKIIQAYARKLLTKNQGSGITTIANQFVADEKAGKILTLLKNAGLPINQLDDYIRTEADLLKFLNLIEASNKPRVISATSAEGKAITEKLFGKKGEVIEGNFGKPFKEQIKDMKKSGDIVDVEDVKISEKITDRDMFKDANQRLKGPIKGKMDMGKFGKVDVETDYSASINRKEFFDPKAKNMYGETVKTGVEFIQKEKERILNTINRKKKEMVPTTHSNYKLLKKSLQDQEDALEAIKVTEDLGGNENMFNFLRTKNIADYKAKPLQRSNYTKTDAEIKAEIEAGNKKGIESLKNKKDDPEGFYTGGMVDVEPNLSDIGHGSDALMARTRLVSPDGQATTSTGLNYLLAEDNDNIRVPFGSGGSYDYGSMQYKIDSVKAAYRRYKKGSLTGGRGGTMTFEQFAPIWAAENFADGGPARQNFKMGKRAFLKLLGSGFAGIAGVKSGLFGSGKGGAKKAVTETVKQTAGSGTPPPYFFKLVEKIKMLGDDVTVGSSTMPRTKVTRYKDYELTESLDGSKQIQKIGKEDDMITQNEYMTYTKGQADETTKGKKVADDYEEVTETNSRIYKDNFNDPDYEDGINLKEILKEVGEPEIKKADGGRIGFRFGGMGPGEIVQNEKKELEKIKKMFDNFDMKRSPDGIVMDSPPPPLEGITTLEYRPDIKDVDVMNLLDTTTPMFDKDNIVKYDDGTVYYKDTDQYVIFDEDGEPMEMMGPSEGAKIVPKTVEAADGGRIGFSAGSLAKLGINSTSRKFLEKVFGKERFATMIENDPRMHRGMLEVVEMFRNKDKKALKKYMQKFMPDMDDTEIEKFIVGDSGTEGIEGQLIRLGSGREYENLIKMKKEADQIRKLDDFDIEDVSKNAEGGRIGFSGGGIFRAIIAKAAAAKGMKPYEFIKVTSYKSLPQEVKMFLSAEDFARLKSGQQEMYTNYIDMAKTRKNFQEQVEGGKTTPAKPIFESMEKMMDQQSYVPKNVTSDDIAQMELMVKNRFNKGRKDNAQGGLTTMLGE